MGLTEWLKGRAPTVAPDGFPSLQEDPLAVEHAAISQMLTENEQANASRDWYSPKLLETFAQVERLGGEEQARFVTAMVHRMVDLEAGAIAAEEQCRIDTERVEAEATEAVTRKAAALGIKVRFSDSERDLLDKCRAEAQRPLLNLHRHRVLLKDALERLLGRALPFGETQMQSLLNWCVNSSGTSSYSHPLAGITRAISHFVKQRSFTEETRTLIDQFLVALRVEKKFRKSAERLSSLMGQAPTLPIERGEAWGDAALDTLSQLPPAQIAAWGKLLTHARAASGSKPSPKWLAEAGRLIETVGFDALRSALVKWFPLTGAQRTIPAMPDAEWRRKCAAERWFEVWYRIMSQRDAFGIDKSIREAADPWEFLRTALAQEAVRKCYPSREAELAVPEDPPPNITPADFLITELHMDVLRGLAWMCGLQEDRELARALTVLALSAFRKEPNKGPRAVRVGTACIAALGMMPGLDAVGQLAVLKVKVKFGTAQQQIDKALNAAAEREGLPREELEEMAVPAYGLTEVGRLVEKLGEFTAELAVADSKPAVITWRRADGKEQKSLPAAVKQEFAEQLKELKAAKKDIESMLPAQAERIDAMFLQQKTWPLDTWLERYLEHPLVATLARRLIWNFTTGGVSTPGLWLNDKLVDRLGNPVSLDAALTTVALWHPLDQPPDVVLGWRSFLEEWQIAQPFKQAHREVYLLTPAEERTGTYSNRFAAHLLKQHQFHALCAVRGWKHKLRLQVDEDFPPAVRLLPQWNLRAEFWVTVSTDDEINEAGSFLHVATDQVRFYRPDDTQLYAHGYGGGYRMLGHETAPEPVPLVEIPPLVFSEIMRDIDLFVGVASVGNDPAWADGGRRETERDAWNLHAFGDLSATAQTRRDLLQRLVPKLKIADRCSFADKFLVVRGDLRTYKIHLGSGNILMSPNDRYLCIVPGQGKAEDGKVFLPFEGDRTLSVILSKAFLLAADTKITDPSITAQIRHL